MKKVLALDVAYAHLGWALIEPYRNQDVILEVGCIENKSDPKKKKAMLTSNYSIERVAKVYTALKELYTTHKPDCTVAEIPASGGRSQISVEGMARGTTLVACLITELEAPAHWTTPDEGKIAMCRCKNASKFQMQAEAMSKFPELRELVPESKKSKSGYETWFEHSADAIAAFLAARHGSVIRLLADANGEYNPDPVLF